MSRILAVCNTDSELRKNTADIIGKIGKSFENIYIFTDCENFEPVMENAQLVVFPKELDSDPKRRNYINRYFKDKNFTGFLHVVNSSVEVLADLSRFIEDLEKMMTAFDYSVWFSTVTDPCNYVYSRYTPRISIDLDIPAVQAKTGLSCKINLTSHSNTQWMVYDFSKVEDDLLRFEEKFTIPMYFIIEFLARRRASSKNGTPYFMNQYLTVSSEVGVFRNLETKPKNEPSDELLKQEGAVFESMKINHTQDGNIDNVLEIFWNKLKKYAGI